MVAGNALLRVHDRPRVPHGLGAESPCDCRVPGRSPPFGNEVARERHVPSATDAEGVGDFTEHRLSKFREARDSMGENVLSPTPWTNASIQRLRGGLPGHVPGNPCMNFLGAGSRDARSWRACGRLLQSKGPGHRMDAGPGLW